MEDIIRYAEAFAVDKDDLDRLALYRLWLRLWKAEAKINTEAYREAIDELAQLTFPPSTSKNAQEIVSIREQKEFLMAKLNAKVSKIEVSSTLPDQAGNSYGGSNVRDGKSATAWVAARNDDNPWIKFTLETPALVSVIEIIPGYGKSDKSFRENGSAKDIKVEFEDGTSKNFHLVRKNQLQPCIIDPPTITKSVKIQILSSYPGEKDVWVKDIPISTIELK